MRDRFRKQPVISCTAEFWTFKPVLLLSHDFKHNIFHYIYSYVTALYWLSLGKDYLLFLAFDLMSKTRNSLLSFSSYQVRVYIDTDVLTKTMQLFQCWVICHAKKKIFLLLYLLVFAMHCHEQTPLKFNI